MILYVPLPVPSYTWFFSPQLRDVIWDPVVHTQTGQLTSSQKQPSIIEKETYSFQTTQNNTQISLLFWGKKKKVTLEEERTHTSWLPAR